MSVPPRLRHFDYSGFWRYLLTFGTWRRQRVLTDGITPSMLVWQILETSSELHFAVLAYCIMPDHVHLLVEGLRPDADLREYVRLLKQRSGYTYRRTAGDRLWQPGYHERVLRRDEDMASVARYVLANPVRAGLVDTAVDYPWSGSGVWDKAAVWVDLGTSST